MMQSSAPYRTFRTTFFKVRKMTKYTHRTTSLPRKGVRVWECGFCGVVKQVILPHLFRTLKWRTSV
jgi:hypothetical protein